MRAHLVQLLAVFARAVCEASVTSGELLHAGLIHQIEAGGAGSAGADDDAGNPSLPPRWA